MRITLVSVVCGSAALFSAGCVVREYRERPAYVETETVVDAPGVVVYEEPPPVERVYVYEQGYPPGCYFYGGFAYYGGRRYERDVFVNRVVNVNVHENRYVNVTENRTVVERVKVEHQHEYDRTGGRVAHPQGTVQQNQATEHRVVTHQPQTPGPVVVPGIRPAVPPPQPQPKPKPKPKDPNHPNQQ